ncbi:chromate transporter [Paenibacillus thermoaerophilus]|jgi:chromate transporter|uniref:Chromate transporter n=1 Tax=Paenibacillus thermoaerophilus TaxID=1215385 RepID=A0ABW2V4D7_9BACL|nr:chromate transporter [Paenibacillus thermoaerophilus]TMV10995.1 chromate transporter [Paenibacillus thermoaerophilus]
MIHWLLFWTFLRIGFVSFGGGYALLPLIRQEAVERHGWLTAGEFTDLVGVAALSPGPLATNGAIAVGYAQAGWTGAAAAAAGMVLPSLLLMLLAGAFYYRLRQHALVSSALYGLRAVTTGLIAYAAIAFAGQIGLTPAFSWQMFVQIAIFAGSLCALLIFRIHPIYVILVSGLFGVAVYG